VFLQRVAHPQITFETSAPSEAVKFECDGRLVSQALTNVLKNATEAIGAREAAGGEEPGRIAIALDANGERVTFRVADNGIGLPPSIATGSRSLMSPRARKARASGSPSCARFWKTMAAKSRCRQGRGRRRRSALTFRCGKKACVKQKRG
jgi:light-regulated signal transduction histidine kinase (bacteriophytochrome)